jgi:hypothetical protein
MKKNSQKAVLITTTVLSLVLLLGIGLYVGIFQSVFGWENTLDGYTNKFSIQDITPMSQTTEATLSLPELTNNFSFTVDYDLVTHYQSSTEGNVDVNYYIYNFRTSQFENFHNKNWQLENANTESSSLKMDGEKIYGDGIPERIGLVNTGTQRYDVFFGCADGMTVEQAKALNGYVLGTTSTYTLYCIYPDGFINNHDYDDDDGDSDLEYYPVLQVYGKDYINDSKARFKIDVNSKTSGMDNIRYNDFDIELWSINANNIKAFRFENSNCSEVEVMAYQKTLIDYDNITSCIEANGMNYYRFADNKCTNITLLSSSKTENDYLTLEECEMNISPIKPIILYIAIGVISLFFILVVIFLIRRK